LRIGDVEQVDRHALVSIIGTGGTRKTALARHGVSWIGTAASHKRRRFMAATEA